MAQSDVLAASAQSRAHFREACATLWLEGYLVRIEDLVLHDACMDLHLPTSGLTQASAVLSARRVICQQRPEGCGAETALTLLRGKSAPMPFPAAAPDLRG